MKKARPGTDSLRIRFSRLFGVGLDQARVDALFEELVRRYGEPQRYYHTLEHIAACLYHLDTVADRLERAVEVELAIWFHDAVYDPDRGDNEAMSADLARDALRELKLDPALGERVAGLILVTRHSAVSPSEDGRYLQDIDLAILGEKREVYDGYAARIRKEYSHVAEPYFRRGRRKVLEAFLGRERIFSTDHFFTRLEPRARENLARELGAAARPARRSRLDP